MRDSNPVHDSQSQVQGCSANSGAFVVDGALRLRELSSVSLLIHNGTNTSSGLQLLLRDI